MASVPPTRREAVVDVLYGHEVADPYRWLEDGDDPEVVAWVAAQNARTREALDADPHRGWWHERLVAFLSQPVVAAGVGASGVQVRGAHLFALERPAGAEQFRLVRRSADTHDDEPVVLLDPSAAAADATVAIDWFEASVDGALVAVGTSEGGTEDSTLRVLDAADGRDVGPAIPHTRAASVAWEPDGSGFLYTRYPEGDQYHRTVHAHRLDGGALDGAGDPVVWAEHRHPQVWPDVQVSPDGRYVLVHAGDGWARVDVHLLDRRTGTWSPVIEGPEVTSRFHFSAAGTALIGVTTLDAPRGRVVEVPLGLDGPGEWRTLVAESDAVVGAVAVTTDELIVVSTRRAVDTVRRHLPDGAVVGEVTGWGAAVAVAGLSADPVTGAAFAVVDAFDAPSTVWRIPRGPGPAIRWASGTGSSEPLALTVSQVTYPSRDGTEIGLFLIHRPDVTPGPSVPLILNGYGGFAISETPVWSAQIAAWCQAGGVYAVAGLRGGLEGGEAWHHAGRREHKQHVFDDFHAGADWLVDTNRASRERLAVLGRSNGGLLVGVALTQRPDLCRAVWCGVPLLDMIRFPRFLIARLWTSEYGDPEVAEEFEWLWGYSPYHHVVEGTCYPATLFTTAEGDTRVDPLHARKMAALVQAATSCGGERPILLFQEGRAGHGVGKPVHKRADELADGLTFLAAQLGLTPPDR